MPSSPPQSTPSSPVVSPIKPFQFRFRVRYPECDAQGVVFNARYADYVDLSATEFWRALFGGYQALVTRGLETQVVRLLIEWQGPARFDDILVAQVQVAHLGNTSFSTQTVFSHANDKAVATAEATYVMVDAVNFQKVRIPDDVRVILQAGAPGVVADQTGA